jgi:hypothetical protein
LLRPSFIANDGAVFDRWNPTDEYQAMLKSEKERIKQIGQDALSTNYQYTSAYPAYTRAPQEIK